MHNYQIVGEIPLAARRRVVAPTRMKLLLRAMTNIGMCSEELAPSLPQPGEFGISADLLRMSFTEIEDTLGVDYAEAADKYHEERAAATGKRGLGPGVPVFKLLHAGWRVQAVEVEETLQILRRATSMRPRAVEMAVNEAGVMAFWSEWVEFLELAAQNDGFESY